MGRLNEALGATTFASRRATFHQRIKLPLRRNQSAAIIYKAYSGMQESIQAEALARADSKSRSVQSEGDFVK